MRWGTEGVSDGLNFKVLYVGAVGTECVSDGLDFKALYVGAVGTECVSDGLDLRRSTQVRRGLRSLRRIELRVLYIIA